MSYAIILSDISDSGSEGVKTKSYSSFKFDVKRAQCVAKEILFGNRNPTPLDFTNTNLSRKDLGFGLVLILS